MENICKFIPQNPIPEIVQTIHFVYETQQTTILTPRLSAVYSANLVVSGEATVTCNGVARRVRRGDLFFLFPAVSYTLKGDEAFQYMYVSFLGIRATSLMERLRLPRGAFVFEGFDELIPRWEEALALSDEVADLSSESILLYTLAKVGSRTAGQRPSAGLSDSAREFLLIKKYVDEHFSESNLNLDRLAGEFSYNKKYLSSGFKKHFQVGISEYLQTLRVHQACVLMEQKHTGVQSIATLCGFSDPLYFSKVFKAKTGLSPKAYMKQLHA